MEYMSQLLFKADVVHIGYPKAASTFLRKYLGGHPQVDVIHQQAAEILYQPWPGFDLIEKPNSSKVLVASDESIAESVCVTGNGTVWAKSLQIPGAFNLCRHDVIIDPQESARRIHALLPKAKILIVIRDHVSWFESIYKYSVSQLPPRQRSFADWWITPQAIALRAAGHHDRVIKAYRELFSNVMVLRYEELSESGERLCRWLGVDYVPLPKEPENQTHAALARLHQRYPSLSSLPIGIKSALRPLVNLLPGRKASVFGDGEKQMIKEHYAAAVARAAPMVF